MRDLYSNLKIVEAIPPAALGADNTPAAIDRLGFESAALAIHIGVGGITFSGTNKVEYVLTHSDDDTTYINVVDGDMIGVTGITNGIIKSLIAAHGSPTVSKYGYIGNKRYLKLLADFSGTHGTPTPMSAVVALGNAADLPVT